MISAVRGSLAILSRPQRRTFNLLVLARVLINFVDIVAVASVGALGATVASGLSGQADVEFLGFQFPAPEGRTLVILSAVIACLFVAKSILSAVFLRLTVTFLAKVETLVAREIVEYIFMGTLGRMRSFSRGEAYFAAQGSAQRAVTGLLTAFSTVINEGALFLFMFVFFVVVDPMAALLVTAYFVVLVTIFQLAVSKRLKRVGAAVASSQVGVTDALSDFGSAFREIKVAGVEGHFLENFSKFRWESSRAAASETFFLSLPRYFVESALMVGVLVLVWRQVASGQLDNGIVTTSVFLAGGVKMMAALLPIQNAYSNAKFLSQQARRAHSIIAKARRVAGIETGLVSTRGDFSTDGREVKGLSISLKNVFFTHSDGEEPVVKNISLEIRGGSYVALVGPSGAGKTTLADLILGMNAPDRGEILIDGIHPREIASSFPGLIAYVPQNPGLVAGSIAQNVALGIPPNELSEDAVTRALEMSELMEYCRQLPDGIHTSLGKQMDALSVGQRQRLGLARALYTQPRLVVLDEATSALDAGTEASITETIRNLGAQTTVIVIAHRLSTIQRADTVFVIDKGALVVSGTFTEVRKKSQLIEEYVRLMSID